MKTKIQIAILFSILFISINKKSYSQADIVGPGAFGHAGLGGMYCGWDNTTVIPFDIVHQNPLARVCNA